MVLRARIEKVLRRESSPKKSVYEIDDLQFDFEQIHFRKDGQEIELSKTEQRLLRMLVENRGVTLSRAKLVDVIWTDGAEYVDENALSVAIKRLRNMIEEIPSKPKYIQTVYGIGYVWREGENDGKKIGIHFRKHGLRATYQRLNQMIDGAIDGTFSENDYEETELSKLEVKWKRFLTSAKLSNQKVEEEREKIKELVSDISHQTKTPLANILLYAQLLEEQNLEETSQKLVAEIVKQSEKLEFLIQSLVKTSRLETGTFQLEPKKQEVYPMLQEIAEQAEQKAKRRNMQIRLPHIGKDCGEDLAEKENERIQAVFDKKWTSEALFNILDNAVKYGNANSVIEMSVQAYEMFVCITICNEGKDISEQEIPLVFQRFYRGKNTCEAEGVGIGLYLARQIVEEQGGYIKVTSKGDGKVKFSVCLRRIF